MRKENLIEKKKLDSCRYNSSPLAPRAQNYSQDPPVVGNYFSYLLMLIVQDMKLVGTCLKNEQQQHERRG